MNDEILKLAKEFDSYCITEYDNGTKYECFEFTGDELEAFYKAAYNKAIEDAVKVLGEAWEDARKEYEGYGSTGNQCNPYYEGYADCADISTTEIRGLMK